VREDGRIVGGEEWQEKVYNSEEWKKLLRTARNHHIFRVLCPIRRPVPTLDCVPLKDSNWAFVAGLGPEINSQACL
jgi:hypothetical protein